jgi:hypothetical protein
LVSSRGALVARARITVGNTCRYKGYAYEAAQATAYNRRLQWQTKDMMLASW